MGHQGWVIVFILMLIFFGYGSWLSIDTIFEKIKGTEVEPKPGDITIPSSAIIYSTIFWGLMSVYAYKRMSSKDGNEMLEKK